MIIFFCGIVWWPRPRLEAQGEAWIGLRGQADINLYKFYSGGFNKYVASTRQTYGYTAGISIKKNVFPFLNIRSGLGVSEASYAPEVQNEYGVLSKVFVRTVVLPLGADLMFNSSSKFTPFLHLGLEQVFRNRLNETYSKVGMENPPPIWNPWRCMFQMSVGFNRPLGKKYEWGAEAGTRLALNNVTRFDGGVNRFYFGLVLHRQVR